MKFLSSLFIFAVSPSVAFAAGSNVLVSSSTPANVYAVGGTVAVTAPVKGDLSALGWSLLTNAPLSGDATLAGGSVRLTSPVLGDARIFGGTVTVSSQVAGDLAVIGGLITDTGSGAAHTFLIGREVRVTGNNSGAVTIYGNTIVLGGVFVSDIEVTAGGKITLLPNTVIQGELRYQAPQEADIDASAKIVGGVHYTGASYLPTTEEARAIALASFGVFLFVKILGALILAGLVAGLFPSFVTRVVGRATDSSVRRTLLTLLLGFGVLVATPVLILFLALTFVGLGLAFILTLAYLLLIPLAFVYAATVIGSYLARYVFKRNELRWSDAVLGMLAFFLLRSLPVVGNLFAGLFIFYMMGVLTALIYRFAFPRETLNEFEG